MDSYVLSLSSQRTPLPSIVSPKGRLTFFSSNEDLEKRVLGGQSLSILTHLENQRMFSKSEKLLRSRFSMPEQYLQPPALPTEGDFNKLLNRLDMVISKKNLVNKRLVISEGESPELLISQGEIQYIRVPCKDKYCPLNFQIVRERGKTIIYASKKIAEPSDVAYEQMTKNDSIEVNDIGLKFRSEFIHFGIFAIEDSSLVVTVTFGKEKHKYIATTQDDKISPVASPQNTQRNFLTLTSEKNKKLGKDFVKSNKKIELLNSPACKGRHSKKLRLWEERRKTAVERKMVRIRSKRELTTQNLNKQFLKLRNSQEKKDKLHLQKRQKIIVSFIYLLKITHFLKHTLTKAKAEAPEDLSLVTRARSLQINAIGFAMDKSINNLHKLMKTKESLLLYSKNVKNHSAVYRGIANFMHKCWGNISIESLCSSFMNKIMLIQRRWKRHLFLKKKLMGNIDQSWNNALGKLVDGVDTRRRRKTAHKRPVDPNNYFKINAETKERVIQEFLEEKKSHFRLILKECLARGTRPSKEVGNSDYYMPTERETKDMIKLAARTK